MIQTKMETTFNRVPLNFPLCHSRGRNQCFLGWWLLRDPTVSFSTDNLSSKNSNNCSINCKENGRSAQRLKRRPAPHLQRDTWYTTVSTSQFTWDTDHSHTDKTHCLWLSLILSAVYKHKQISISAFWTKCGLILDWHTMNKQHGVLWSCHHKGSVYFCRHFVSHLKRIPEVKLGY